MPRSNKLKTLSLQLRTVTFMFVILTGLSTQIYADGACGNTPSFSMGETTTVGNRPRSAVVGDFNGDGNPDLAVANLESNYISVMLGNGAGGFGAPTNIVVGNRNSAVQVGDFNGDNKLDLVVSSLSVSSFNDQHIFILAGNGAGGFTAVSSFYVGGLVESIAVADFNSDGKADLALENQYGGGVMSLRLGDGTGNFTAAGDIPLGGSTPDRIIARDLNGDGKPDVVVTDMFANYVIVLLNNGSGGFAGPMRFIAASNSGSFMEGPSGAVAGDFNNDGKIDLAVANPGTYVSILLGNGSGGFGAPTSFPTGRGLSYIAAGDFNNDGKLDLAAASNLAKDIVVILGDGMGGFAGAASFGLGEAPTLVAVADFNHDGKSDLVASRDGSLGTTAILLNSCGAASPPLPDISVNDITVTEGNNFDTNRANFAVTLSSPSNQRVTVSYATAEGTASRDSDFGMLRGATIFEPGETTKTISVPIYSDVFDEFDETFTLSLTYPIGGTIVRSQGTCTILDDDPPPAISFPNISQVYEGDAGTTSASFFMTLSEVSRKPITVDYATADGTAIAGDDYLSTSGSVTFNPGETFKTIVVPVKGDTVNEANETFFLNLSHPINVTIADARATVTILNDDTPTLRVSQRNYNVVEGTGSLNVTVIRSGDLSIPVTVNYATSDTAGLQNCNIINGIASSRCDYVAMVGTLHFASGDTSKTISLPIVDDVYPEGAETFSISLSNPTGGATLGSQTVAIIQINDNGNDSASAANPIDQTEFFVRQHYIDFLSREPDPLSAGWVTQINQCGPGNQSCRISVSQGIYGSPEFKDRGYFIYKFYSVALGRKPGYDEFVVDRARVSGFQTDAELEQSKLDFIADFTSRQPFRDRYDAITDPLSYVVALEQMAGVHVSNEGQLISDLASGRKTRGEVLRAIVESPEVSAKFLNEATIVMHYFGYLRRDPDAFYQDWINILTSTGDSRNVTNGFVNSAEYRMRFGQ